MPMLMKLQGERPEALLLILLYGLFSIVHHIFRRVRCTHMNGKSFLTLKMQSTSTHSPLDLSKYTMNQSMAQSYS